MKKNLLTVLILALIIVNIALTTVMMISVMGTNKKTAELVNNIAMVLNLELTKPGEEEQEAPISLADTDVYNFSSAMTIPLAADGSGKEKYIMFEVALSLNMNHEDYETYKDVASRESLIKDAISSVVSSYTEVEIKALIQDGGIKEEILEAIQNLYQSKFIYNVAINGVMYY
ncbi:MAG: flagellar basal body-associated FliL family protein [Acetatifactor sp.]|nr:flagellar basal body-associated FliL family protein [Acetatifactor sp.]